MLFTTKIVFDSKGSLWVFWLFMFNGNLRVAMLAVGQNSSCLIFSNRVQSLIKEFLKIVYCLLFWKNCLVSIEFDQFTHGYLTNF